MEGAKDCGWKVADLLEKEKCRCLVSSHGRHLGAPR